jgi:hypothetical protein
MVAVTAEEVALLRATEVDFLHLLAFFALFFILKGMMN